MRGALLGCLFLFMSIWAASQEGAKAAGFDCAKARTVSEKAICDDPALSRADDELTLLFRTRLAGSEDKAQIVAGQNLWIKYRDLFCRMGEDLVPCLMEAYRLRSAFLTPRGGEIRTDESARFSPPDSWPGSDVATLLRPLLGTAKASYTIMSMGQGLDGRLVAEVAIDREGAETRSAKDYLVIDMVSGMPFGSRSDDERPADPSAAEVWERYGLHLVPIFRGDSLQLDEHHVVRSVVEMCDEPFGASLAIVGAGRKRRNHGPGIEAEAAYILMPRQTVRRIVHPVLGRQCASDGPEDEVWTLDFDILSQRPFMALADNSFLVEAGSQYVIRYRADLSSEFFDGRSDLILLKGASIVDLPSDKNSPDAAREQIHAAMEGARIRQLAKTKAVEPAVLRP